MEERIGNVDIVFCVDGRESMAPKLASFKTWTKHFIHEIRNVVLDLGEEIDAIRTKLIVFRDYGCDEVPMDESLWYELGVDDDLFEDRIDSIVPTGGGDNADNGFEALYFAMRSDFVTGPSDRQIIALISDVDALTMNERAASEKYPKEMGNLVDLVNIWMGCTEDPTIKLHYRNKRLIFFAPEDTKYNQLVEIMEGSMFRAIEPGKPLDERDLWDIAKLMFTYDIGEK